MLVTEIAKTRAEVTKGSGAAGSAEPGQPTPLCRGLRRRRGSGVRWRAEAAPPSRRRARPPSRAADPFRRNRVRPHGQRPRRSQESPAPYVAHRGDAEEIIRMCVCLGAT